MHAIRIFAAAGLLAVTLAGSAFAQNAGTNPTSGNTTQSATGTRVINNGCTASTPSGGNTSQSATGTTVTGAGGTGISSGNTNQSATGTTVTPPC